MIGSQIRMRSLTSVCLSYCLSTAPAVDGCSAAGPKVQGPLQKGLVPCARADMPCTGPPAEGRGQVGWAILIA